MNRFCLLGDRLSRFLPAAEGQILALADAAKRNTGALTDCVPGRGAGARAAKILMATGSLEFARTGDIYQLFYERGCELLRSDSGQLAYITSNSWLRIRYGQKLRHFFAKNQEPMAWIDLGKDVFESAIVDSGILLLKMGARAGMFPAVDVDRVEAKAFPPPKKSGGILNPLRTCPGAS